MTEPAPRRRRGARLSIALMVVVTIGTIVLVVVNAVQLGRVTSQVQASQARSTNIANATRENLVLLEMVSQLGETTTSQQVAVQRGLLLRQMNVASVTFPPDSAELRELEEVRQAINRFPWDRLGEGRARQDSLRLAALATVKQSELRINALRTAEEKRFYSATSVALDTNKRSQLVLSLLMAVVLGMGIIGILMVMQRRRAAEDALRKSEGRFRSLVQRASDLTVVTDSTGVITYISPAAETLLGYQPEELTGLPLLVHVEPSARTEVAGMIRVLGEMPGLERTVELRLCTRDGRVRLVEAVCQNLIDDSDVGGLVWNGRDVTDRRALEDELTHQASHDSLTGLPNRDVLLKRLDEALHPLSGAAGRGSVSVILVDLDGFKNVNDNLGHAAGDELLRAAAKRLQGCVREGDTAARLGGDEFAVVASASSPSQAVAAARRIVSVVHQPFHVAGQDVRVGASVGVAHRVGTSSAEELLRDADIAMYVAKNTGKGHVEVFEPDMRARASLRTGLQQQLARAVDHGEIEVHYQPIIDLKTLRPRSLEALARWRRPDGSLAPADVFIPIAEESGVIIEIGREVLRQACRAVQLWRALPDYAHLSIAVNVSVHQVMSGRLVDHVVAALRDSGLPGPTLILEITESAELEDSERVTEEFRRLRELGVRIVVDDFGAGYSSLGFLMGLNADGLKIDRSLLDFDTTQHGSLVTAIAELGRTLGLTVVAEGVETPEHLARALEASCDAAQGFHFARPVPFDEVAGFLLGWSGSTSIADGAVTPSTTA
jgi:diguanylate cyclase (GGDEF)-like protein/PAS domain S-box-containing protein